MNITITRATETDIPAIEGILLDAVNWLNEMGAPLWSADEVTWERLSGGPRAGDAYVSSNYQASDFYIARMDGAPAGCMAIIDHDPFFWPDVERGDSLFIHKLAVAKAARKTGVADALMDFFKARGAARGVKTLRLDTDATRPKTRAFYERHGFSHVQTRSMGPYQVAFYAHTLSGNMPVEIFADKMDGIAPLFAGWDETLIWSCLQGHMGRAWADDADAPSAAQILTGDFCFFAGDASRPQAKELVRNIPGDYSRAWILMIPEDDTWHGLIEDAYKSKFQRYMRYAVKKERDVFDKAILRGYIDALPNGYHIARIDERLFAWTRTVAWARDFCSQFHSFTDYENRGLGYVVLYNGEPVCGASSYTVYSGGIEIEICTAEAHRRKGLATACAARLIIACLEKDLYPSWDAANLQSVALAEKLGYHFDRAYVTYEITGFRQEDKSHD